MPRKGLSILIAPEGTRLDTTEVGPFKKGPFRIAMAAGIPIVPIVIRNAEVDRRPRLQHLQRRHGRRRGVPADPRPTTGHTRTWSERIAEVRQLYLDTLLDWPREKLPDAAGSTATASRGERT